MSSAGAAPKPTRRESPAFLIELCDLAETLTRVAASLEEDGYEADHVGGFLMQCLFSMFAKDVGGLETFAAVSSKIMPPYELRSGKPWSNGQAEGQINWRTLS